MIKCVSKLICVHCRTTGDQEGEEEGGQGLLLTCSIVEAELEECGEDALLTAVQAICGGFGVAEVSLCSTSILFAT